MDMEHTPLPWSCDGREFFGPWDGSRTGIPTLPPVARVSSIYWDRADGDAQLIDRAVHSYYPMREALEAMTAAEDEYMRAVAENKEGTDEFKNAVASAIVSQVLAREKADAALKKANGVTA